MPKAVPAKTEVTIQVLRDCSLRRGDASASPFAKLSQEQLELVATDAYVLHIVKGDTFIEAGADGQYFYAIKEGVVRVRGSGRDYLGYRGKGMLLGAHCSLTGIRHGYDSEAISKVTEVLRLERTSLERALSVEKSSLASIEFLKEIVKWLHIELDREAEHRAIMTQPLLFAKVAETLLLAVEALQNDQGNDAKNPLPSWFTKSQIKEVMGGNWQRALHTINYYLTREGAVEASSRIKVLSEDKLRAARNKALDEEADEEIRAYIERMKVKGKLEPLPKLPRP